MGATNGAVTGASAAIGGGAAGDLPLTVALRFAWKLRAMASSDVSGATSGRDGLRLLVDAGPFAVVMSDFMMPLMNGAEFLALARLSAPETVRVLLTGDASVQSAIAMSR